MISDTYYDAKGRLRPFRFASEKDRALELLRYAGPRSSSKLASLRFRDFVVWRSERQAERGLINMSIANQSASLENWVCAEIGDRPISEVHVADCHSLQQHWRNEGLSEEYVSGLRGYLKDVFQHAIERGAIFSNPAATAFATERRPGRYAPARAPDENIVAMLWGSEKLVHRVVLALLINTRPSPLELCALCWSDIDWDKLNVTYRFYSDGPAIVEQARPDRVRTLDLTAEASALLRQWMDREDKPESPLVFCWNDGSRYTPPRFNYIARRLQFDAGLPHAPERSRRKRKANAVPRKTAFFGYLAPYSFEELGNVAVLRWKASGVNDLELQRLVGVAGSRGLSRFEALFNGLELDAVAFDSVDRLVGGEL